MGENSVRNENFKRIYLNLLKGFRSRKSRNANQGNVGSDMKKYMKISLIAVLCVSLMMTSVIASEQQNTLQVTTQSSTKLERKIAPSQFDTGINYTRPILDKVTYQINDSSPEVELLELVQRNETLNRGAIFQSIVYTNVTVYYKVLNGTANTKVYFHSNEKTLDTNFDVNNNSVAQLEYINSVNVTNFVIPYSGIKSNGSMASYKIKFNLTRSYLNFFARAESLPENLDGAPMNLLSVGQYFDTSFNEEFYIQNENVTITLTANNITSSDIYGIKYKTNDETIYSNMNFTTTTFGTMANGTINLGTFVPGTTIDIVAIAYLNDTVNAEVTRVTNIRSSSVEVGDGTPTLDLEIVKADNTTSAKLRKLNDIIYTQSREITLNFNASVIKGKVVKYSVNYTDGVSSVFKDNITFTEVNGTQHVQDNFTATADGVWNVTVFAFTDKDLSVNQSFTIYIDTLVPTLSFTAPTQGATFKEDTMTVTFAFNFDDELSGVYYASLDMDNGNTFEVTGMNNFTYTYIKEGTYSVSLTVVDNAGNSAITFVSVNVQRASASKVFAPFSTVASLLALIAIPVIVKRK